MPFMYPVPTSQKTPHIDLQIPLGKLSFFILRILRNDYSHGSSNMDLQDTGFRERYRFIEAG